MSHVRIAQRPEDLHAVRVGAGAANLVLGCDMVVAASPAALSRMAPGTTTAIVNDTVTPTAQFVLDRDLDLMAGPMQRALAQAAGADGVEFLPASDLATALLGDTIATNLFLLGFAFQRGRIPLHLAAIERAIELNGAAVASSKAAFAWGRLAAHDRAAVARAAGLGAPGDAPPPDHDLDVVERHARWLADYQDARYAQRYRDTMAKVAAADARCGRGGALTAAAARSLWKLMAYKDEYEVARLHADPAFIARLERQFEGPLDLQFHLAPPLFAKIDPATGVPRKRAYGGWMLPVFRMLAPWKRLRGTALDPFGRTRERQAERAAIVAFEAVLARLATEVSAGNYARAVEIAALPQTVRGFGHVKARSQAAFETKMTALLAQFGREMPIAQAAD
jgi:indolepyruvate ferredoxin oxidoreductase